MELALPCSRRRNASREMRRVWIPSPPSRSGGSASTQPDFSQVAVVPETTATRLETWLWNPGLNNWAERRDLALLQQARECLRLDLTHPFAGDAHPPADLLQRLRVMLAVEAVAELDHQLLARRQRGDRTVQRVLAEGDD